MSPEQIVYWIGVLVGGFVVGTLCSVLPLVLAIKKKRPGLAVLSCICCIVSGLILGLILAVPVAVIFTVVIILLKKPNQSDAVEVILE